MTEPGRLHVVLGTGPVGLATIDALVSRGMKVRAVNRRGSAALPQGVATTSGDVTDRAFIEGACEGAVVVYNCLNPPYSKWPQQLPGLWEAAAHGAETSGARLVVMDNLYMYGPTGAKPMTEETPPVATTRKGRLRAAAAASLLEAHSAGRVQVAIARASDYFGPRAAGSAMGDRVFPAALAGQRAQVLGNPDVPHTYTYVPDIGEGLVRLAEREDAFGQVWHLPSPETVTTRRFIEMVFAAAGKEPKIQVVSRLLVRALGLFNADIRELVEMMYEFEEPFVVDDSKYTGTFGVHATPLEAAIEATVAWFRDGKLAPPG